MDDQAEVGQIEAAGGDVGGDADAGAAVAQGLQRVACAPLWVISPERATAAKPRSQQAAVQVAHRLAGGAEHQRARRLE